MNIMSIASFRVARAHRSSVSCRADTVAHAARVVKLITGRVVASVCQPSREDT